MTWVQASQRSLRFFSKNKLWGLCVCDPNSLKRNDPAEVVEAFIHSLQPAVQPNMANHPALNNIRNECHASSFLGGQRSHFRRV